MSSILARTSKRLAEKTVFNTSYSLTRLSSCRQASQPRNISTGYSRSTTLLSRASLSHLSRQSCQFSTLGRERKVPTLSANGKTQTKIWKTRSFSVSAPLSTKRPKKRQKNYKLKTNHAASQRWKAISTAMFKRRRQGRSHFMVKKKAARANKLGKDVLAAPYHVRTLKKLLPYA